MAMPELPAVKKEILVKLLRHDALRYSDMASDSTPNDLYNYHLQHLVKQGYVQKDRQKYSLTTEGKKFVESTQLLMPTGDTGELFRVNVLVILLKRVNGKLFVLNQTRKNHPYYGDKGIIGGPVKPAELIEETYTRVLLEETGLHAQCDTIGIIRKIRFTPSESLFSDIFYHIGIAYDHDGTLQPTTVYGENYWVPFETALENEANSVQGGVSIVKVLNQIALGGEIPFFYYQERMTVRV